jgi:SulP family sulfate permease
MHAQLAERDGQLLFSGMPSGILEQRDFERYLAQMGLVRDGGGVMITETRDSALEWMEERILEAAGIVKNADERLLELKDFRLFRELNEAELAALAGCITELSLRQGEKAFRRGDQGDELYLVRRGILRVLLPLEGGKYHHLATVCQGGVIGELAFLDRGIRSADVEARVDTDVYVLSRSRFNELARANAAMGVQVFARLALSIAESLRQSDAELRVLEER